MRARPQVRARMIATDRGGSGTFYPRREDTELLAGAASRCDGRSVLEIGVGSGAVAVAAARAGARWVVATDLNPGALRAARELARCSGVHVEVLRTDLARGLGRFERVLANPPYLPTRRGQRDPDRWVNLALDGGRDGCRTLARLLASLPSHLVAGGRAYVVLSSLQDPARIARLRASWRRAGGGVRVAGRRRLQGEVLTLWELRGPGRPSRAARRSGRRARGTPARRRIPGASRRGSSREPAPGRTIAPGGASDRRRSRRGS